MPTRYLDSIEYQKIVKRVSTDFNKKYTYIYASDIPLMEILECIINEMDGCVYCRESTYNDKKCIFINLFGDITSMITNATIRYCFEQYIDDYIIPPLYDLLIRKPKPKQRSLCCF